MSKQTNVQQGAIRVIAGEDLTGYEGYLVEVYNASNVLKARRPTSNNALALFVLDEEGAAAEYVSVLPLWPGKNVRVKLNGTCTPGEKLVLADTGTPADKGKVRALPATAGDYVVLGVAEEVGVDEQSLLVRPLVKLEHVESALIADAAAQTQDDLTDNSGGTPATTLAEITNAANAGSADVAPTANAIASLAAQLAKVKADLAEVLAAVNALNAAAKEQNLVASA